MAQPKSHNKLFEKWSFEKWIVYYARFGYGAKGILYGSTGILALSEAFDLNSGEAVDSTGALRTIAHQPFGRTIAIIIAFSLMCYVVWRFIQTFLDPEHKGCDKSDIVRRVSYGCSGLVYGSIAYSVIEILSDLDDLDDLNEGRTASEWAFLIMTQPFGRWLVGGAGLLFFGIGCYYFYRAIKAEFRKRLKLNQMGSISIAWATVVGQVGIAARGVVYIVIGIYGMRAAWEINAEMIKTSEGALSLFEGKPTDEVILATLGLGFVAYAAHMGFQAVYRSIDPL